jgi:hypothetical protein
MLPLDITDEALALIEPPEERREDCRREIKARVDLLHGVWTLTRDTPSQADLKRELRAIRLRLERIRKDFAVRGDLPVAANMLFQDMASRMVSLPVAVTLLFQEQGQHAAFLRELDRLIDDARFHHDSIVVRPGAQRWDNIKVVAARNAARLTTFGTKHPTRRLAELLYRGATGKRANLDQYCRDLDRIEPELVVRTTFR